jgi:thiol-disulfide isomerase/thioredoxin
MKNFKNKKISIVFSFLLILLFLHKGFSQSIHKIYYSDVINSDVEDLSRKPLVYLDFWATWCAPCISSMPHTRSLQESFGNRVAFVYLTNESLYRVQRFLQRKPVLTSVFIDTSNSTATRFGVTRIPQSFLLDPEGKILWQGKPGEMNRDLLKNFADKYGTLKGKPERFVKINPVRQSESWNVFAGQLKWRKDNGVSEAYKMNSNEIFLSGDVKYIISVLFNIPPSLVEAEGKFDRFVFLFPQGDKQAFKQAVIKFLKQEENLVFERREKEIKAFVLQNTSKTQLLSPEIYDFGKENGTYIKDDFSLTIDNASAAQAVAILNATTDDYFIYEGDDETLHDWNLVYKPRELLLQQLVDEIGFRVERRKIKISQIIVRKK